MYLKYIAQNKVTAPPLEGEAGEGKNINQYKFNSVLKGMAGGKLRVREKLFIV